MADGNNVGIGERNGKEIGGLLGMINTRNHGNKEGVLRGIVDPWSCNLATKEVKGGGVRTWPPHRSMA